MNSTFSSNSGFKAFRPLLIVFLLLNAGIFWSQSLLAKWNISADVLMLGHLILFIATAVSFYFYYKSFQDNRPQTFVRFIYAAMFIKMALCLFSSFLYIMISGKEVNKGGIIGCLVLYMLYTVLEVVILMKVSKQKRMPKKEAPLEYLRQFIPEAAVPKVLQYLHQYSVHLTITRERKTVLGDYRHATSHQTHRISVNSNLNKFAFLITLIHEIAHLVTFMQYGHRVQAHGREWKNWYALLLKDFLVLKIFPLDIETTLLQSIQNLPASSCADDNLMRVLKKYDGVSDGLILVEQVEEGKLFDIGEGRVFKKGKKLRKRYQCMEMNTGKVYLFSPVYEVKAV